MELIVLKHISYNKGKEHITFFTKQVGEKLLICKNLDFLFEEQEVKIISFDYINIIDDLPMGANLCFIDIENLKR